MQDGVVELPALPLVGLVRRLMIYFYRSGFVGGTRVIRGSRQLFFRILFLFLCAVPFQVACWACRVASVRFLLLFGATGGHQSR
jgi:hypothetical protein